MSFQTALSRRFNRFQPSVLAIAIAFVLFILPFFWVKSGFVDLGGDSGRLYFIDPLVSALNKYTNITPTGASIYAFIPFELFLFVLKKIVQTPTCLIAVDRGIVLSLAFYSVFLLVCELCYMVRGKQDKRIAWVAMTAGIVYIGFISNSGWVLSLENYYQLFLNPLLFYFLLRYGLTNHMRYLSLLLLFTVLYSGNFGYSSMPQIMAFYPLAIMYLALTLSVVYRQRVPWRGYLLFFLTFICVHAFHVIPTLALLFGRSNPMQTSIFTASAIQNLGVHYFDMNHAMLGKISTQLFQPSHWGSQTIFVLMVPMLVLVGLLTKPSKLLAVSAGFFLITLFFVSANITHLGASVYRSLFYIPGFMMFRSFNDKWYAAYVFFFTVTVACSMYQIVREKKLRFCLIICSTVVAVTVIRIFPFLYGKGVYGIAYQSNNVSTVFTMDPDLTDAVSFVKLLPRNGDILTLPLTFSNYQIAYGKNGGAYAGVSMIYNLAGRLDYPGFWCFGSDAQRVFDTLRANNPEALISLLRQLHIVYIFRNSDPRIMDKFPGYPYVYPGMMYSSKEQIPAIKDQKAYDALLSRLPIRKLYEKGYYSVYELRDSAAFSPKEEYTNLRKYFIIGKYVSGISVLLLMGYLGRSVIKKYNGKK